MVGVQLRRCPHDDPHAGVGRIVFASALFAVHVAEAVAVLLKKLVAGHDLSEHAFPEDQGLVEIQPGALEEEAVLEPAPVLQLVVPPQPGVQLTHAQRHVPISRLLHPVGGESLGGLGAEVLLGADPVEVPHHPTHAGVLLQQTHSPGGLGQSSRQTRAEPGHDGRDEAVQRHVGEAAQDQHLAGGHQGQRLGEGHLEDPSGSEARQLVSQRGGLLGTNLLVLDAAGPEELVAGGVGQGLETVSEEVRLLREEPGAQVLAAAEGQAQDEVADPVLGGGLVGEKTQPGPLLRLPQTVAVVGVGLAQSSGPQLLDGAEESA